MSNFPSMEVSSKKHIWGSGIDKFPGKWHNWESFPNSEEGRSRSVAGEPRKTMETKTNYKTKQKEILMNYLQTIPGVHFTAGDICEYMKTQGAQVGQSTIYRRLEQLVDEGVLNKYIVDGASAACFEYMEKGSHGNEEVCYHCKCEKCGKLIHLHCDEIKEIQRHLLKGHQFQMDPRRTVFYGLCETCK